ncbi:amidase [Mycobacterium intracellulare subsp. chimaera]|uniref:cupredoxin domain-containing protein n=1 Tax=Mycobacterium intracellulare TaxID=1767 RepID=UPI00090C876D|nr:cupredoxin family copper-binding protein [Mycobacterium intracellulare]AOS93610.2 amidase [Mycobacterium intracellulare subsp. chimaera]
MGMDIALRRRLLAAVLAASVLSSPGCGRPAAPRSRRQPGHHRRLRFRPPAAGANQVTIDGFAFAPPNLTVPAGTTVTWTNRDEEPHTVAASDGSFHSPGMGTGATFAHTFSAPGTFDYVCSIHPMMRGTVVVTG